MATPARSRIPSAAQTAMFMRDPLAMMRRLHGGRHDAFEARFLGAPPLVYLADPELAHELFSHDENGGLAGAARRPYFEPLVGPTSLLVVDGEQWSQRRKLVGPPLHGAKIEAFRRTIAEIAREEISEWPTREVIQLRPRMQRITLEVILRVVFGLEQGPRRDELRRLLPRLIEEGAWMVWAPASVRDPMIQAFEHRPRLRRLRRLLPAVSALDLRDRVNELLYAEIRSRRQSGGLAKRDDVLSLMMCATDEDGKALSDDELRDQLVTLLEAGHETTATALSWAFERLTRNPEALANLRGELDSDANDREYLQAVTKETLRSRPVVIDVIRLLAEPLRLGDYEIPAGHYVGPATTLIHNLAEHFPEPEQFRPERFLADDPPFRAWLPFGGGRRRCVGSHLAQLEMAVVIEEVLRRFEVEAVDPEPEKARVQHVTLVPGKLAQVRLRPRPTIRRNSDTRGASSS